MPVVRRVGYDLRTNQYIERMYQRPPRQWVDAGQLEGNPHDHERGWTGYLVDSRGVKHQISAEWITDDYLENHLDVSVHNGMSHNTMYKTGKVTFRGVIPFFGIDDEDVRAPEEFTFTWMGNMNGKYMSARARAFRITRRVARA